MVESGRALAGVGSRAPQVNVGAADAGCVMDVQSLHGDPEFGTSVEQRGEVAQRYPEARRRYRVGREAYTNMWDALGVGGDPRERLKLPWRLDVDASAGRHRRGKVVVRLH